MKLLAGINFPMKIFYILSLSVNVLMIAFVCQLHMRCSNLDNMVDYYQKNYIQIDNYNRVRDKVDDYEWILRNVAKVENVDTMRIYWCGR